jgi:hypothetical protein
MSAAITFAIQALAALPPLLRAGADVLASIEQTVAALRAMQAEGRDPTAEEWAAQHARIAADLAQLDRAARETG